MAIATQIAVDARGLTKRYGPVTAVAGVDMTIHAGDVYGFLGPNGAGKTTAMRMMLGLIRPDAGAVRLFGRDPQRDGARALDGVAGFVEAPRFYPYLSGRRNLELVAALDGSGAATRVTESLAVVELTDRAGDRAGGYSHGMRQRLGIAAALLRAPRLLVLDEPTTGLDPAGMRDMRALVRRLAGQGITVLLSSHQMGEVEELCNRVAIVRQGRVVYEGALEQLLAATPGQYELQTNDDEAAHRLASERGDLEVSGSASGLLLRGSEDAVISLTAALGAVGVGIRSLLPPDRDLEELFLRMTNEDGSTR